MGRSGRLRGKESRGTPRVSSNGRAASLGERDGRRAYAADNDADDEAARFRDGAAESARFCRPRALAVASDGRI